MRRSSYHLAALGNPDHIFHHIQRSRRQQAMDAAYGAGLTLDIRRRCKKVNEAGERKTWVEFRVMRGRKIAGRFSSAQQAEDFIRSEMEAVA